MGRLLGPDPDRGPPVSDLCSRETGKLCRAFWDGTQMVQVILRRERLLCEYRRA